nr:MAG TPA: hypothetical protein [Caudoviricetes sp.]
MPITELRTVSIGRAPVSISRTSTPCRKPSAIAMPRSENGRKPQDFSHYDARAPVVALLRSRKKMGATGRPKSWVVSDVDHTPAAAGAKNNPCILHAWNVRRCRRGAGACGRCIRVSAQRRIRPGAQRWCIFRHPLGDRLGRGLDAFCRLAASIRRRRSLTTISHGLGRRDFRGYRRSYGLDGVITLPGRCVASCGRLCSGRPCFGGRCRCGVRSRRYLIRARAVRAAGGLDFRPCGRCRLRGGVITPGHCASVTSARLTSRGGCFCWYLTRTSTGRPVHIASIVSNSAASVGRAPIFRGRGGVFVGGRGIRCSRRFRGRGGLICGRRGRACQVNRISGVRALLN